MKMCNCNQGRLSCTCRTVERASVPRELTEQRQGETVTLPARLPVRLPEGRNLPKGYAEAWNACIDEIAKLGPLYTHPAPAAQKGEPVALAIPEECPHLIVFDDTEVASLMFSGAGARVAALKKWEAISTSWNAHLFVRVARNSRDDGHPCATAADAGEVERLRQLNRDAVAELEDRKQEIYALRAQLAERDALLRDISKKNDLACDRAYRNGLKKGFGYGINGEEDRYNSVMESYHRSIAKALAEDALSASAEPSSPVERDELPRFAQTVIKKLKRFRDCAEDSQGADIGKTWFDVLVQLGLLNRVQRSPAYWEITDEGDALLEARAALERKS